jgi:alcohol dehydrogenase, propanol-preferring
MGLNVIAVDISDDKLALAQEMGAKATINAKTADPIAEVKALCGGAQGVLVTAVSPHAFNQGLGMLAKRGTMSLVGLPPGSFELDIFSTVLMRKTIRGSIVGTRLDLAECLQFAGDGKVKVHYSVEPLENINNIFGRMRDNKIDGRVVMKI